MVFGNMLSAIDKWWQVTMGVLGEALNLIGYLFYAVFTGVGMLIDFVMSLFRKLAGIESMTLQAGGKQITVGGEGNWTDITYAFITSEAVQTAFWTILAMCIALLVVFTIFAIVKSEFATDAKGAAKGPIIQRAVKSVLNFFLIPVISFVSIYGANMLTKAVAATFKAGSNYNITNLVFNAGALNANRVSLDNGFANYLLTTDTVYFANEPKETPLASMTAMLNKYFAVDEGYIQVYEITKEKRSEDDITQYSSTITTKALGYDGIKSYPNDELHLFESGITVDYYDITPSNNNAGMFRATRKKEKINEPKNVGDKFIWYEYEIQLPVSVTYQSEANGFCQIVPGAKITSHPYSQTEPENYVRLEVMENITSGSGYAYNGSVNWDFKSGSSETTKEKVKQWKYTEGCFKECKFISESTYDTIVEIVNSYVRSISPKTSEIGSKNAVTLWQVLQEEYNDTENGIVIFGTQPTKDNDSIIKISNEQRSKLVEFINKIFVGNGGWSDGYCKYYNFDKEGKKLEVLSDDEISKLNEEQKKQYLEISAATLHIQPGGYKVWEKEVHDDWEAEYTPDYQQTYWKPTSYTRDAVMDTGLVGYFYKFNNMNLILMTFGMVAVAWQYFKLILVFVKRALEMALLFLMAPVVTAIAPLDGGNAEKSWRGSWTKQLIMTCIPVFAINIFFIILPLVTSLNPWADSTGSIVNPIYTTYQAFLSIIFIYVGVGMINKASSMLAGYLGGTEDMLATGKDLTNKAVGTIGTAAKGAAIVAGGAFTGLATAIKGGKSWLNGRIEGSKSFNKNYAAAKSELDRQIEEAKASGDTLRQRELEDRRDSLKKDMKNNSDKWVSDITDKAAKNAKNKEFLMSAISGKENLNQADEEVIAEKQANIDSKQSEINERKEKIAELQSANKQYESWDIRYLANDDKIKNLQSEISDLNKNIESDQDEISQRKKNIAGRKAYIDNASKKANKFAEEEGYYNQLLSASKERKNAIKTGKKEEWAKLQKDGFYGEWAGLQKKLNESDFGKFLAKQNVLSTSLNWAINKAIFGAAGVGLQIADRHLSSIPRTGIDFVKSIDASAGAIVEKFVDPAASGKTISTAEENKAREAKKDEAARKKAWEQEFKKEEEKLNKEKKDRESKQKKDDLMDLYKAFELFKLNGFNIKGDKIDLQADKNETIAKNYKSQIDDRAKKDYEEFKKLEEAREKAKGGKGPELTLKEKEFDKFKKMIRDTQAESKNKAQSVKLDASDHNMAEKLSKAFSAINAKNEKELKEINSGISSMLGYLKKMSEKL